MAVSENFHRYVLDQLSEFEGVSSKKMFGGIGFFKDKKMFGMIGNDVFRLKVDASNQADYEAAGVKPFFDEKKKKGMPYWEVPIGVLEDKATLKVWAEKAYQAALNARKK